MHVHEEGRGWPKIGGFDCNCDPNDVAYKYIVSDELEVMARMQDSEGNERMRKCP